MVRVYIWIILNIDVIVYKNIKGAIWANKSANDFNRSIPSSIITSLFENPVNLSNLHQSWFMNKTRKSSSNLNVATEIYYAAVQRNFSYVSWKSE